MSIPPINEVIEVWIDSFRRALVIPVSSGKYIISMDVHYDGWKLPIDDEIKVAHGKLVYHVLNSKEFNVEEFNVEKVEIVGLNVNGYWETISVRVWTSRVEGELEDYVKKLYDRIRKKLDSIYGGGKGLA